MYIVYYSHSYRPPDNDINEFFQELMLSEGMTPSLDPPADQDHLNAAKAERHLRNTDGMIAVLPYRDPEPSSYILYEIALCVRARKPALIFVEDVLPDDSIPDTLLQRRFSRRQLLREVRNHRHALRILKTYLGTEPPPTYELSSGQRQCLVIGASALAEGGGARLEEQLKTLKYSPIMVPAGVDYLSYEHPYEQQVSRASLCISFVEELSPREFYLLGAVRAALLPTILLSRNPDHAFDSRVPDEYQPRRVSAARLDELCQTVNHEVSVFEEDYLELKDQEKVRRYRRALIQEGSTQGSYSAQARDVIFNMVGQQIGVDMSKDKIQVSNVVGPVNIKSRLERVTQIVRNAPMLPADQQERLAALIAELQEALKTVAEQRPEDGERVAKTAELVVAEATKEKPDRGFLDLSIEGLKQAAKAVEDLAPTVMRVAMKIAAFVVTLGG